MNEQQEKRRDPLFWPFVIVIVALICVMAVLAPKEWDKFQKQQKEHEKKLAIEEREKSYRDMIEHADTMLASGKKMPSPSWPYTHKAYAYVYLKDFESAMANFERAKEVEPQGYWKSNTTDFAPSLAQFGEYDRAIRVFEDLIKHFPDEVGVRASYGLFLYSTKRQDLRDPPRAVKLLRKNAEGPQADSHDHEVFAEALAANGEFPEAVKECEITKPLAEKEFEDRKAVYLKRIALLREQGVTDKPLEREEKNLAALEDSHERHLQNLERKRLLFIHGQALPPSKRY